MTLLVVGLCIGFLLGVGCMALLFMGRE